MYEHKKEDLKPSEKKGIYITFKDVVPLSTSELTRVPRYISCKRYFYKVSKYVGIQSMKEFF